MKVDGFVHRYVDMEAEVTKHMRAKNVPYLSIPFLSLPDLRRPDSFKLTIFGMLPRSAVSLEEILLAPGWCGSITRCLVFTVFDPDFCEVIGCVGDFIPGKLFSVCWAYYVSMCWDCGEVVIIDYMILRWDVTGDDV